MRRLIPREYWQYSIADVLQAFAAAGDPELSRRQISVPGIGECIPVRSGRAALVLAIQLLDLPPGAKVGVPLFCCPIVFRAIETAGCVPEFLDIDENTFCLSSRHLAEKYKEISAVVTVHMFGNLCDMQRLKAVAPELPFIEDCAQAVGSEGESGAAGRSGIIAIFSFRSGKYLSTGEGGAIFCSRADLKARAATLVSQLPAASRQQEYLHVLQWYLKSRLHSRPLYGAFGYTLWEGLNRALNLGARSKISLRAIYRSDLQLVNKRLPQLRSAIQKRRSIAAQFDDRLRLRSEMLCLDSPGTKPNKLQYPITFPSKEIRDDVANHLFKQGVDTIKYLDDVVNIAMRFHGYKGGCPVSESLSRRVLILPNDQTLDSRDVTRIVDSLNNKWTQVSSSAESPKKSTPPLSTPEATSAESEANRSNGGEQHQFEVSQT